MKPIARPFPPVAAPFVALLLLFSPAPAPAVQVRIASWNILNGLDTSSDSASSEASRNDDWWQVIDSLNRLQPDIVGFAELNSYDFKNLPALAAALGYPYYALSSETMNAGDYRQGVMSKFPIVSWDLVKENETDPDAAEIKRWPIHAVVQVPGALNPLHVFVVHTHPGTTGRPDRLWRAMNAWRMRQYLSRLAAERPDDVEYVVMGDFNEDATGEIGPSQPDSFTYDYYRARLSAGTLFKPWFHLGSDFPWSTDTSFVLPYKLYPNERFNDLAPVAGVCRTGFAASDSAALATYPSTGRTLDYILFSSEIMQSAYGAPRCEVYWGTNDLSAASPGLPKPGPWLPTLGIGSSLTEAKKGLDHLMVFGDFNMIDAVPGLTPVAIISEIATVTNKVTANFVELSNTGASPLDISGYSLEFYSRDSADPVATLTLSGSIPQNGVWWVARASTASNYWAAAMASNGLAWRVPNLTSTTLSKLDGRGAVVLKNSYGAVLDVVGAVGVDGLGKPWQYSSAVANRLSGVTEPSSVWSASEWAFSPLPDGISAASPGYHESVSEADVSVASLSLSPSVPAAGDPFAVNAVVAPNALASNLLVTAHFSVNGDIASPAWTDGFPLANVSGNSWSADSVSLDVAPGDAISCILQVDFDGPGGLSPAFSAQLDYTFPGFDDGAGRLATALFNEVAPSAAFPFLELAGAAALPLSGWAVEHWSLADPDNPALLWSYAFPDGAALPSASSADDEWGNPVAFRTLSAADFPAFSLLASSPAALVLRTPAGTLADAVAWRPANDPDAPLDPDFLPYAVLSVNVAQGLPNYLHVLGPLPADPALSLQAPDWILTGRASAPLRNLVQWTASSPTPDTLNASQSSGALALLRVDSDADALLDDEDNCPASPNPTQADIDGDGLGDDCDPDMDGDAIPNDIDNCPHTPNPEQEDADGDGVGDSCDDDFDPDLVPPHEAFFVTFESVTNGFDAAFPSAFSDGGRDWFFSDAAVCSTPDDAKIGARSARLAPGGTLTLSGPLTNGLASVAFFVAPYAASSGTPLLVLETSPDGETWSFLQAVQTDLSAGLFPVRLDDLAVTNSVHFRIRLDAPDGVDSALRVNLDNLRLVSHIHADADADLDADLVVVYDGAPHTNAFAVSPAFARWSVVYTNDAGDVSSAPAEPGVWTAVLTVESSDAVTGGTFVFPSSLVIELPADPPAVSALSAAPSYVSVALSATVVPNRSAPLPVLFEYGTTTKYGSKVVAVESPVSGFDPVAVSVAVSNLLPSTTYHWRVLAGDTTSSSKSFTTGELPVPALSVPVATDTTLTPSWTPVDGATNYLLSAWFLSDSGASHVYPFSDWEPHASSSTAYTQETEEGDWTLSNASVVPDNAAPATGDGSPGVVSLTKNGATLRSPSFGSLTAVRFVAASKSGSQNLTLQVSTNAGRTFRDVNTWSVAVKPGVWRTNVWTSPLPEGSLVRFRNDGTKAVNLHDVVIDEAEAAPAPLPGFPRSLPSGATSCLVAELAPSTVYHFSVLAQGPGWQTLSSPDVAASTLAPGASPPVFVPWSSTPSVTVGDTLSINVSASAATNIVLSFTTATGPAAFDFGTGLLAYTPVDADVGTQTFTLVAQNQHGTVTNDFAVQVLPAPEPPTPPAFDPWDAVPTVTVGDTLSANVSATAATNIVLASTTATGPASFDFDSGLLAYTPVDADVGTQTFTLVAQNQHAAVTNDFTVEVLPAPEPPTPPAFDPWDAVPTVTVGDTLSANVSAAAATNIVLASTSATGPASFDFDTGLLSYTPVDADVGLQTFTLVAENQHAAVTNDFTVEVLPAPEPPTPPAFDPWDSVPTVTVGETFSSTISASAATNIVLASTTATGPASFDFDSGLLAYTPVDADVGLQTFTLVAENQHAAVTNDFTVEVLPLPDPPDPYAEWLAARGLSPDDYPADADSDNDGATNEEEFLADTDPSDPASAFRLRPDPSAPLHWTFPASTARWYRLLSKTDLTSTNLELLPLGWGVPGMVVTSPPLPVNFLYLESRLAPPPDPD